MTITSKIIVGENIKELARYIENKKNIISITDSNVYGLYENYIPSKNLVVIGTGEKIKTLDTVSNIYDRLSSMGADRSYFILGIGGGLVCDVAGFVASTFMRGIHFGFVPTTLLAQVDASIGGKNGVNFKGYKNIIGVFRQPEFVFSTPIFLKTLKAKEFTCGMAEVIKHALIAESELLKFLEQKYNHIISFDDYAIKRIVTDSVKIKTNIVNMDEFELGERRKLNFGHTVGHALEKLSPGISHGHAVAIGMMFAARFSSQKEYVEWSEVRRIERLIKTFGLPTDLSDMNIRKQDIFEAVRMDKKKEDNELHFVFLKKIGEAVVEKISFEELEDAVQDLC